LSNDTNNGNLVSQLRKTFDKEVISYRAGGYLFFNFL